MDRLDRKILCELDLNCRMPVSQMARKLRANRNIVAYRMQRLQEEGFISSYICSINVGALGYKTFKVYVKTVPTDEEKLVKLLMRRSEVLHLLKVEGRYDYSITVAVKDVRELDGFLTLLKNTCQLRDRAVVIIIYSRIYKLNKLLLGAKPELKSELYAGEADLPTVDEQDKSILRVLSQSANLPLIALAKEAKTTVDIAKYRMRRMERGIINAYRIMINLRKIGLYHYVILLRLQSGTTAEEERLLTWCALRHDVLYVSKRIGIFDFEINAALEGIDGLNTFLGEMKKAFGSSIDTYELILNLELLKLNYVPF